MKFMEYLLIHGTMAHSEISAYFYCTMACNAPSSEIYIYEMLM